MTLRVSRRQVLTGAMATLAATACSNGGGPSDGDLDFAAGAAAIERMAVDHFTGTSRALTEGRYGALVPQALAALVATAVGHHQQALNAWNKALVVGGRAEVSAPPPKAQEALNTAGLQVADVLAAATLALRVEDYACQTYQRALPTLAQLHTISLAAQLSIVGHQRQAVLRYLLGRDPVAGAGADPQLKLLTG